MGERTGKRMDRWMNGEMYGRVSGQALKGGCMKRWVDGRKDGQMDRYMDGHMDGLMDT